jgi:hypothetical protein
LVTVPDFLPEYEADRRNANVVQRERKKGQAPLYVFETDGRKYSLTLRSGERSRPAERRGILSRSAKPRAQ